MELFSYLYPRQADPAFLEWVSSCWPSFVLYVRTRPSVDPYQTQKTFLPYNRRHLAILQDQRRIPALLETFYLWSISTGASDEIELS